MDPRIQHSTGGSTPMTIAGRTVRERERLIGMSVEERAWRKQFLLDQHLAPNEPVHVPEYWRERTNPFRRVYQAPLNGLYNKLKPIIGEGYAKHARFWSGKVLLAVAGIYSAAYYLKYNGNNWTRKGGWRVLNSRTAVNLGDPEFPKKSDRSKPSDYAARDFKKTVL